MLQPPLAFSPVPSLCSPHPPVPPLRQLQQFHVSTSKQLRTHPLYNDLAIKASDCCACVSPRGASLTAIGDHRGAGLGLQGPSLPLSVPLFSQACREHESAGRLSARLRRAPGTAGRVFPICGKAMGKSFIPSRWAIADTGVCGGSGAERPPRHIQGYKRKPGLQQGASSTKATGG